MYEELLGVAGLIIAVVFWLYMKERKLLRKYHELLQERERITRLSKQVQLDYYKRKLTEETLKQVLADYQKQSMELEETIKEIEKKHGIEIKGGLGRHLESVSAEQPKNPE